MEVVNRLLGSCASAAEAAALLEKIRIVGVPDPVTGTVAPLHWILQDRSGRCLTAEQTAAGLRLLENPVGVLSNSPDLPWHLTNLRSYAGLSPLPRPDARWEGAELSPFGQGSGGLGLPGDYTPPSRFVRAAFLKSHAPVPRLPAGGGRHRLPSAGKRHRPPGRGNHRPGDPGLHPVHRFFTAPFPGNAGSKATTTARSWPRGSSVGWPTAPASAPWRC